MGMKQWMEVATKRANVATVAVTVLVLMTAACTGYTSKSSGQPGTGNPGGSLTVLVTSPASGATVSGSVTLTATVAATNDTTKSVQFQVDGNNQGSPVTASPYTTSWSTTGVANGKHSIGAIATDSLGYVYSSGTVSVTVSNNTGDKTPPTVSITSPANGVTVSGTITVTANASDNVGVASVQFAVDGTDFGNLDTSSPYSQSLNTASLTNGAHTLMAIATDTSGNKATSASVSITVNNQAQTAVSVSITSPANDATVSGTITVTATASATAGVASVQFLLDGSNLGAADTSSPYSVSWNTTTAGSGTHTLTATATDKNGKSATSSAVSVIVSQAAPPPPNPPAGDDVTISDATGAGRTNQPVSIARPFVQGEIQDFAQATISGTALLTQCDVKNRWPDGSLKFAVVSFVVPSIPAGGSVVVSFANQTSGNNTGFLTQSQMLGNAYNFDAQIQLSGTASHKISARTILTGASDCTSTTNDIDGTLATSGNTCVYYLQGPIVTAVILEDRGGRSFDVNTDGGSGNPLHPIFETWFYPQTNLVEIDYNLEDAWASNTAAISARDQTFQLTMTAGNTSPIIVYPQSASLTMATRTRYHRTFCINGTANTCAPISVNHSWPYLATTKFFPHWDPTLTLNSTYVSNFGTAFQNSKTNTTFAATQFGTGFFPGNTGCGNSAQTTDGDGCSGGGMDQDGAAYYHGPLPTWDIVCLMSQDPNECSVVSRGNADAGNVLPYFYREADTQPGVGKFFDAPSGTTAALGRVVSINARRLVSLEDATEQTCGVSEPSDYINFGGSGQDVGGFATDSSHWPNVAYATYILTGRYSYYEEQLMQSAYAVGIGVQPCTYIPTQASSSQGAKGYWNTAQEREQDWQAREAMLGAFIAQDGSPEQAYMLDKLRTNIAVWEGSHGMACDVPGAGNQEPYCGGSGVSTAWSFGNTARGGFPFAGNGLGSWTGGVCAGPCSGYLGQPLCQTGDTGCSIPGNANSNFQNAYSTVIIGWLNDMGFCPQTNGVCQIQQFVQNFHINAVEDPNANMFLFGNYSYPTVDTSDNPINTWAQFVKFFEPGKFPPTSWGLTDSSYCVDEGYSAEEVAALSYGYNTTSNEGYSGATAYNTARPSLVSACQARGLFFDGTTLGAAASPSPKWDITPR